MTPIPLRGNESRVCGIRELGGWEAMDAYRVAFAAASAEELTGRGSDGGLGGCACEGMDTQIGSPRP